MWLSLWQTGGRWWQIQGGGPLTAWHKFHDGWAGPKCHSSKSQSYAELGVPDPIEIIGFRYPSLCIVLQPLSDFLTPLIAKETAWWIVPFIASYLMISLQYSSDLDWKIKNFLCVSFFQTTLVVGRIYTKKPSYFPYIWVQKNLCHRCFLPRCGRAQGVTSSLQGVPAPKFTLPKSLKKLFTLWLNDTECSLLWGKWEVAASRSDLSNWGIMFQCLQQENRTLSSLIFLPGRPA